VEAIKALRGNPAAFGAIGNGTKLRLPASHTVESARVPDDRGSALSAIGSIHSERAIENEAVAPCYSRLGKRTARPQDTYIASSRSDSPRAKDASKQPSESVATHVSFGG
jgi:hypothetical protein